MKELKADRKAHEEANFIAISPDGNYVVASFDGTARVWDMRGNEVGEYEGRCYVIDVKFCPDPQHLLLGCYDGTVSIFNWRTGSLVQTLEGHISSLSETDVLPKSGKVILANTDDTVRVWSRRNTVQNISRKTDFGYSLERTLTRHEV